MAAPSASVAPRRWLSPPWWLGVSLAGSLALGACQAPDNGSKRVPRVQSQPVALARFSDRVDTISTLEAAQEVQLAAQAGGRILQLLVRQGDRVRQGQLLLVLDQTQLRAEVASLRGQMQTSKLNYERYAYLVKQGAASALQRDEARQAFIAAREALTARQADLSFRQLRAPIGGMVADLAVKAGDVIQAGSPLTKLVGSSRLLARIDVPAIYADRLKPGLTVRLLDPINRRPMAVGVVSSVDPGVNVASQSLLVKASFSNPDANANANANGNANGLRNGLRVRTQLELGSYGALAVPFTAVSQMAGQSFVYVLGSRADLERTPGRVKLEPQAALPPGSQFAIQTPVQLGPLQGSSYPVIRGLEPGQQVISSGLLNLRHGSPVKGSRTR